MKPLLNTDWLPWPLGTHWCYYETVLAWITLPIFALNLIAIAVTLIWRATTLIWRSL